MIYPPSDPIDSAAAWLRRRWWLLALVAAGLVLGLLAPKLLPWLLGGAGAVEAVRRKANARRSANDARKANKAATEARNARTKEAVASLSARLAEASEVAETATEPPASEKEAEKRRAALGAWDD